MKIEPKQIKIREVLTAMPIRATTVFFAYGGGRHSTALSAEVVYDNDQASP